jgi:hypothetical protein
MAATASKKAVAERKEQMAAAGVAKRANTRGYCEHGRGKRCRDCGRGYCEHRRQKGRCRDCGTGLCRRLRHEPLPPSPEGHVQGLRHGLLQARAPEGPVQGPTTYNRQ